MLIMNTKQITTSISMAYFLAKALEVEVGELFEF
jgi:hypothetical protein